MGIEAICFISDSVWGNYYFMPHSMGEGRLWVLKKPQPDHREDVWMTVNDNKGCAWVTEAKELACWLLMRSNHCLAVSVQGGYALVRVKHHMVRELLHSKGGPVIGS